MDSNSSKGPGPGSPGWVRPNDVMRVSKMKAKRRALHSRMMGPTSSPLRILSNAASNKNNNALESNAARGIKRRNPFKCSPNKKSRIEDDPDDEVTSDAGLFRLLNPTTVQTQPVRQIADFSQILKQHLPSKEPEKEEDTTVWDDSLPVDWSLKTRLRFLSDRPLPWKSNFKTSEEASGTTGFVRCLSSSASDEDMTLDTSPNAQFYQRCLYWQHPNLPWLNLFPRDKPPTKASQSQTGIFGVDSKLGDSLHSQWGESLRSVHQLLRVRQCPYFYLCGSNFTILFRAAGVAGISQAHALITPTTRGFRDSMKSEDIEFEMPLHKSGGDGGRDIELDDEEDEKGEKGKGAVEAEEDAREATSWLEDLGVETSQFPSLNPNKVKLEREKYKHIDHTASSMVYVEGMETLSLINFLLNSKSCVGTTGPLAGVPPTLLAPVAFQGATLNTLKIKNGVIRSGSITQNSYEVDGPIMPHTIHQLTSLIADTSVEKYSLTLTPINTTLPLAQHTHHDDTAPPQAFAQEGLVDCGLDDNIRSLICSPVPKVSKLPNNYIHVKYENNKYTCFDKL